MINRAGESRRPHGKNGTGLRSQNTRENPPETTKGRRAGPETTDLPDAGTGGTELLDTALGGDFFVAETPKAKGTKAKINERAPGHLKSTARHGNRQLGEAAHRWAGRARDAHPA